MTSGTLNYQVHLTTLPQSLNFDISSAYAAVLLQNGRIDYFGGNAVIGGAPYNLHQTRFKYIFGYLAQNLVPRH
ncbi:hypothetical protein F8M41_024685 [Gigaspora margarita]|uniref:Uncharacterized protein n=1 Tax=Gigaspora margarita TaxID=4874 RepID=A0A8H4B0C4_GIGMA|nr:hypothetical protein F8M41_024685 [Gigaspora margarita]